MVEGCQRPSEVLSPSSRAVEVSCRDVWTTRWETTAMQRVFWLPSRRRLWTFRRRKTGAAARISAPRWLVPLQPQRPMVRQAASALPVLAGNSRPRCSPSHHVMQCIVDGGQDGCDRAPTGPARPSGRLRMTALGTAARHCRPGIVGVASSSTCPVFVARDLSAPFVFCAGTRPAQTTAVGACHAASVRHLPNAQPRPRPSWSGVLASAWKTIESAVFCC